MVQTRLDHRLGTELALYLQCRLKGMWTLVSIYSDGTTHSIDLANSLWDARSDSSKHTYFTIEGYDPSDYELIHMYLVLLYPHLVPEH